MKANILKEINGNYYPIEIDVPDEEVVDNRSYEEKVIELIRQKYDINQELAIQRQRDTKPEEFQKYFEYCEFCKKQIKEGL